MDLGKKIQQVLKHYPSVYVDGLGVFRKVHQASSFDAQHDVFLPPIDYVEFDDRDHEGLDLIEYLRQENEISRTDAQELVAREVQDIISSISEHGKAHIPQLGDLLTYGDGFVFRAVDLSSFVFEPISNIEPVKQSTVAENLDVEEILLREDNDAPIDEEIIAPETEEEPSAQDSVETEQEIEETNSAEETSAQDDQETESEIEEASPQGAISLDEDGHVATENVEETLFEDEITADELMESHVESTPTFERGALADDSESLGEKEEKQEEQAIPEPILPLEPESSQVEDAVVHASDEGDLAPNEEESSFEEEISVNEAVAETFEETPASSEKEHLVTDSAPNESETSDEDVAESIAEDDETRFSDDELANEPVAENNLLPDQSEALVPRKEVPLPEGPPLIQNKNQAGTPVAYVPTSAEDDTTYADEYEDDRSHMIWYILAAVVALSIIGVLWYVTRPVSLYSDESDNDLDDNIESPYAIAEEYRLPAASTEVLDTSAVLRERPDTATLVGQVSAKPTVVPQAQPVIPANHNWYIVIGSRLPLADAKELASSFNKKGQARVRIVPGRGDGSPATVIWDSYVTKAQADSALRHVRKNFVPDAWHKAIKK